MVILSIPAVVVSSRDGWVRIENVHPTLTTLFLKVVLPLCLLPPLMLLYAGGNYGDAFIDGYGGKDWASIAAVFFLAEMATLAMMGWSIKQIGALQGADIRMHDAYILACIAPVPMWLSALGLLVPSLSFNIVLSLLGLAASCRLIYRGIRTICHVRDEFVAAAITQTVMGTGVGGWILLLLLILVPPA